MHPTQTLLTFGLILAVGFVLLPCDRAEADGPLDLLVRRSHRPSIQSGILLSGRPIGGLAGLAGSRVHYRLQVPHGQAQLVVQTTGGRGDCDLYVHHGGPLTGASGGERSVGGTCEERIVISRPAAGWWSVTLRGFRPYSGVTLVATLVAGVSPVHPGAGKVTVLESGQPVAGLAGNTGDRYYFQLDVPVGTSALTLQTVGGVGDCDLYLSRGVLPEPKSHQHVSNGLSTFESIVIQKPQPGRWYAALHGFQGFRGVSLTGKWRPFGPVPHPHRGWLQITSPAAGSRLVAGQSYMIQWSHRGRARRVQVLYSFTDGSTWTRIAPQSVAPAAAGRLLWTVPLIAGRRGPVTARIRILDSDNPRIQATSERILVVPARLGHPGGGRPGQPGHGTGPRRPGRGEFDAFEPDGQSNRASRIRLDVPQYRTIYPRRDVDWIMFVPPAPGTYRFTIGKASEKLKLRIYTLFAGANREAKDRTVTVEKTGYTFDMKTVPTIRHLKLQIEAKDDSDTTAYTVSVTRVGLILTPRPGGRPGRQ